MTLTSPPSLAAAGPVPLVVDVDGTLIKSDLLHESVMQLAARHPLDLWRLLPWVARGKQHLKCELAERVPLDVANIPLREETVSLIRDAQAQGRPVYLASASENGVVQRVADLIGGIAGVFGTGRDDNNAGHTKAARLNAAFGEHGYDYVGDQPVDFAVWQSSREVLAVAHDEGFARKVLSRHPDARIIARPRTKLRSYIRAMRPYQWTKNLLIPLSMVAGHHFDWHSIWVTAVAFVCFCLAASSAYLFNDLLDLPGDRAHHRKSKRPFAAGDIPIDRGVVLAALLMGGALALSLLLPWRFIVILLLYVGLTLSYSLYLKRKVLIDVVVLGGLYTIRVLGGIAAGETIYSPWLLMFSLFLFLGLATVKRCSELIALREAGKDATPGRGYRAADLAVLLPLGAAASYGAVLVVALYLSSEEVRVLYAHPNRIWLICPLLIYWLSRMLLKCNRNQLHDDPIIFAIRDKVSWATGVLAVGIMLAAI
jgi:4-hydroxybenzoate polyprenyltransferase/phosphoglycolate phosphatase-like HAD superfamily hydrolase